MQRIMCDDASCTQACGESSTLEAQQADMAKNLCLSILCPVTLSDEDKVSCDSEATSGACFDLVDACFGGVCDDCNDGDPCTSDSCGAGGCVNAPLHVPGCAACSLSTSEGKHFVSLLQASEPTGDLVVLGEEDLCWGVYERCRPPLGPAHHTGQYKRHDPEQHQRSARAAWSLPCAR